MLFSQCIRRNNWVYILITRRQYSPNIRHYSLLCYREQNTPQVMWSYVDLAGTKTDLTSTTDASTGVSTIQVYTTQPGYYSCEVTENGGSNRTYTAVMTDTNPDTGNQS